MCPRLPILRWSWNWASFREASVQASSTVVEPLATAVRAVGASGGTSSVTATASLE